MSDIRQKLAQQLAVTALSLASFAALAAPAALPAQAQPTRIAVVDLEAVVTQSPGGKALQQRLEKFQQDVQTQWEAMAAKGAEIRKKISEGGGTLTPEQLTDLNRQLEDQSNAIRRFRDDKQKEGQKLQADGLREIESQLMPVLEKFRADGGYDLLLNNVPGLVVMFDPKVNVTQAILARLASAN